MKSRELLKIVKIGEGVFRHEIKAWSFEFYNTDNLIVYASGEDLKFNCYNDFEFYSKLEDISVFNLGSPTATPYATIEDLLIGLKSLGYPIIKSSEGSGSGGGDASAANQVISNQKLANIENTIDNNRIKVTSQPSPYLDITGDITAIQATINTPVVGGTVTANTSTASNLMAFCTGTFSGINVTFEGSLDDTGDANWFGIQAVRTNANTIETTSGALSAQPAYGWELSVNALKRFRVRCTARTSGTQSWKLVLGSYATEPIPAAQVTATQPVSGTVTANQGTMVALPAGTNAIGDLGIQYRANATGAASKYHLVSAATTNLANVKASAGRIVGWSIANTNAAWRYVKLHNLATAPTAGAAVFMTIGIPPNSVREMSLEGGIAFTTGIALSTVTGAVDSDTTAVAASDLIIELFFV